MNNPSNPPQIPCRDLWEEDVRWNKQEIILRLAMNRTDTLSR